MNAKSCDANSMKKNRNFSHRHHNLIKQTHFSHLFQWTHLFANKWPLIQCYFCHRMQSLRNRCIRRTTLKSCLHTVCVLELFFKRKKMFNHQHGTVPTVSIFEWREKSDLLHVSLNVCVYACCLHVIENIFKEIYTSLAVRDEKNCSVVYCLHTWEIVKVGQFAHTKKIQKIKC